MFRRKRTSASLAPKCSAILAPTETANLEGTFNGYVIGGGVTIGLLSEAIVNSVDTEPVPEPCSLALAGLGGLALLLFRRRTC